MTERELVLVLTDDPHVRQEIREILEIHEYRVITAGNVADALSEIHKHQPDLIITEIYLPGTTGYDFFEQVRATDSWLHMPFIFLSKKQRRSWYENAQLNIEHFVAGDLTAADLLEVVEEKLHRHRKFSSDNEANENDQP